MAAVAGMLSNAGASHSLEAMLDDCWYRKSVFNPTSLQLVPTVTETPSASSSRLQKKLGLSTLTVEVERDGSSTQSKGGRFQTCCNSIDEKEIRAIFGKFDENADGLISGDELRRFIGCWGIDMSEADAKSMIKSLDDNSDGGIDFEEFSSLYRANLSEQDVPPEEEDTEILAEAFRVFDKNQDGFISAQELQAVLLGLGVEDGKSLRRCQKMISSVDQDGNGQCDIHEFRTMMSPQPSLGKRRS